MINTPIPKNPNMKMGTHRELGLYAFCGFGGVYRLLADTSLVPLGVTRPEVVFVRLRRFLLSSATAKRIGAI